MPGRISNRAEGGAGDEVGQDQQDGTAEAASWQQPAVIRPREIPEHVRDRSSRRSQSSRPPKVAAPVTSAIEINIPAFYSLHRHAERAGFIVTREHDV